IERSLYQQPIDDRLDIGGELSKFRGLIPIGHEHQVPARSRRAFIADLGEPDDTSISGGHWAPSSPSDSGSSTVMRSRAPLASSASFAVSAAPSRPRRGPTTATWRPLGSAGTSRATSPAPGALTRASGRFGSPVGYSTVAGNS